MAIQQWKRHTLTPHLNGEMLCPITGSWFIASISRFLSISTSESLIADSWEWKGSFLCSFGYAIELWSADMTTYISSNKQRRLHERPCCEMRLCLIHSEVAIATVCILCQANVTSETEPRRLAFATYPNHFDHRSQWTASGTSYWTSALTPVRIKSGDGYAQVDDTREARPNRLDVTSCTPWLSEFFTPEPDLLLAEVVTSGSDK